MPCVRESKQENQSLIYNFYIILTAVLCRWGGMLVFWAPYAVAFHRNMSSSLPTKYLGAMEIKSFISH